MEIMKNQFHFNKINNTTSISTVQIEWQKTLTAPQDGMWESFAENSMPWEIRHDVELIGYLRLNDQNQLLRFYLLPHWLKNGAQIYQQFINEQFVKQAVIGTNDPIHLSLGLQNQKSVMVHTYLFTDMIETQSSKSEGRLLTAWEDDLIRLVDFYHKSTGGPKEWLSGYINNLINRGEIFILDKNGEILGTCEVRNSETNSKIADLGMVVSPEHRGKGIGTFLLGKAKELAYDINRSPICSCERSNIASLKAIHRTGFRSMNQMLLLEF